MILNIQATLDGNIELFLLIFVIARELVQLKIQYFAPKCFILENKMH